MGSFLAVTAFYSDDIDAISKSITSYAHEYKIPAAIETKSDTPNHKRHALVYKSKNGWIVVLWPDYFNVHDGRLAKWVSKQRNLLVSTVGVYDGDYWCHHMYRNGEQIDLFCSVPTYWAETEEEAKSSAQRLQGSPERVAKAVGVSASAIEGYYTHINFEKEYSRVHSNDATTVDNFWVFTDFWEKIGIEYPTDISNYSVTIDLTESFSKELPLDNE